MAVKFLKERKKQRYLILSLAAIIVIIIVVVWYGYFKDKKPDIVPAPVTAASLKTIKINFEALENPFLQELQPFIVIPDFEGEKGRENPFLPY